MTAGQHRSPAVTATSRSDRNLVDFARGAVQTMAELGRLAQDAREDGDSRLAELFADALLHTAHQLELARDELERRGR